MPALVELVAGIGVELEPGALPTPRSQLLKRGSPVCIGISSSGLLVSVYQAPNKKQPPSIQGDGGHSSSVRREQT